jgi:hypothetical protein
MADFFPAEQYSRGCEPVCRIPVIGATGKFLKMQEFLGIRLPVFLRNYPTMQVLYFTLNWAFYANSVTIYINIPRIPTGILQEFLKTHFIHTRIPTGIPTGIPQATPRIPVTAEEFDSCTSTVVEKKFRNNKKLPKNEEIPQPRLAHTQTAGSGRTEYRHRFPCGDHP